jgi:hypothetical protein
VPEPRLIVVATHGGLGNKLKALVSALRLSDSVAAVYPTFTPLFENDIPVLERIPRRCRVFSDWRFVLTPDDRLPDDFASVAIPEVGEEVPRIPVGRSIDLEYGRVPAHLRQAFLAAFAKLRIRPEVERAAAELVGSWPPGTIAVHVRSWSESNFRRRTLFDLERVFHAVDASGAESLFASSDAVEVLDEFRRRYGRRVFTGADDRVLAHSIPYEDEEVVVRAFVDMLCLSRGEALIGSYLSTFCECAWWLGGCRQEVVIV